MAYSEVALTYVEAMMAPVGGGAEVRQRIGEVRTWSDSGSTSNQDISVIGRVDANNRPIKRTRAGTSEDSITLECYLDLEDYPQSQMQKGATFSKVFICEVGRANDLVVYSECEIGSRARNGSEYEGLVGVSIAVTVNGGIQEDQPK